MLDRYLDALTGAPRSTAAESRDAYSLGRRYWAALTGMPLPSAPSRQVQVPLPEPARPERAERRAWLERRTRMVLAGVAGSLATAGAVGLGLVISLQPSANFPSAGLNGSTAHASARPRQGTSSPPSVPLSPFPLAGLTPVQTGNATVTSGQVQIGGAAYPASIWFTCRTGVSGRTFVVYDVTGAAELDLTAGVPDTAPGATRTRLSLTFYDDATGRRLQKLTTVRGKPSRVGLDLAGVSRLGITCAATSQVTGHPVTLNVALGDPILS
jgi:hypothetical protein